MIAILLLALLQDRPVEASIEAFLKDDATARAELVKLGAFAIRPLQKARDRDPRKIDPLVYELKRGASYPKDSQIWKTLEGRVTVPETAVLITFDDSYPEIKFGESQDAMPAPLFIQMFGPTDVKSLKATLRGTDRPARELLDQLCLQTGLDYACFHNAVVLGSPDRLWPVFPPAPRKLTEEEEAVARENIEKLGHESFAVREAATKELMKLGAAVTPLLEKALGRKEPEIVARCRAMLEILNPTPRSPFGPPAILSQELDPEDERVLRKLQSAIGDSTLRFWGGNLDSIRVITVGHCEIRSKFVDSGDENLVIPLFDGRSLSTFDVCAMITQMTGLDFTIKDGDLIINKRSAFEKPVPKPK